MDFISLKMPREEVMYRLRDWGVRKGVIVNRFGQVIEVREYKVGKALKNGWQSGLVFAIWAMSDEGCVEERQSVYRLCFYNGALVHLGEAGEWEELEQKLYDRDFSLLFCN